MTPAQIAAILNAIERLEGKVDEKADKADISRLEEKVDRTNGRVTQLERQELIEHTQAEVRGDVKRTIWKAAAAIVAAMAGISAVTFAVIDHI